jgi:ABC-type lipoprotein release transport system permease subunit
VSRQSEWLKTGQQTHGLQRIQIVFRLLWEDRQLNIDAATFVGVVVVVMVTAALATVAPALRATRVDPVVTLRGE